MEEAAKSKNFTLTIFCESLKQLKQLGYVSCGLGI